MAQVFQGLDNMSFLATCFLPRFRGVDEGIGMFKGCDWLPTPFPHVPCTSLIVVYTPGTIKDTRFNYMSKGMTGKGAESEQGFDQCQGLGSACKG